MARAPLTFALALGLALGTSAGGARGDVICDLALGEIAPFDGRSLETSQGEPGADFRGVRHVEGRRTFPALLEVLAAWRGRGDEVPTTFTPAAGRTNVDWATAVPREGLARFGSAEAPVKLEPVPRHEGTQRMTVDGREYFVRDPTQARGRSRFVASDMNEFMGLSTVPRSRFALVNGELRLVSEASPGSPADSRGNAGRTLMAEVAGGRLRRDALYDAWGFEFLVSQTDGTSANYHITPDGRLEVFDHDLALFLALPAYDRTVLGTSLLGRSVPPRYTARFLEGLRRLTPEAVRERWGRFLSDNEVRGILFRRDILLADAARRGPAALLPP